MKNPTKDELSCAEYALFESRYTSLDLAEEEN